MLYENCGLEILSIFKASSDTLRQACLYMKANIPIYIAGAGPKMAREIGRLGDGFITGAPTSLDYIKSDLFREIEKGAMSAGRSAENIARVFELDVTYAEDYDDALASLRNFASTLSTENYVEPIQIRESSKSARKESH